MDSKIIDVRVDDPQKLELLRKLRDMKQAFKKHVQSGLPPKDFNPNKYLSK